MIRIIRNFALVVFYMVVASFVAYGLDFCDVKRIYGVQLGEPNSICTDSKGFVWVGGKTGVWRLADRNSHLYGLPYRSMNVLTVEVVSGANGEVVAYTNQGEMFCYDWVGDRFEFLADISKAEEMAGVYLAQVVIGSDGCFWAGTSKGLLRYCGGDFEHVGDVGGAIGDLIDYDDARLAAVSTDGVYLIDKSTGRSNCLVGISGIFPTLLRADRQGERFWIGTMSDGLWRLDLKDMSLHRSGAKLPCQYIRQIERMPDGCLWCGIDGGGIWVLSPDGERVDTVYCENSTPGFGGNGIQDFMLDRTGGLWVCSYTGGVRVADVTSGCIRLLTNKAGDVNSLANNYIWCNRG